MKLVHRARLHNSFWARVVELRDKKKLSQEQLAEASGIDPANLVKYENGREPGLFVIAMLAKGLNVEVKDLFEGDFDLPNDWMTR